MSREARDGKKQPSCYGGTNAAGERALRGNERVLRDMMRFPAKRIPCYGEWCTCL